MNEFAVLDIGYLHYPDYVRVRVRSSTAVHLTLYYTDKPPVRHKTTRIVRGATISAGAYWCFVGYLPVEQDEAGDTLIHTFTVPDWLFCQTKWFLFQGTVAGIESPSMSPYFKHHHNNWPTGTYILRPSGAGISCRIFRDFPYPCPYHWNNVNDAVPDEDASYVSSLYSNTTHYQSDFYAFANMPPETALVSQVMLTLRMKRVGGMAYPRLYKYQLYLDGDYEISPGYAIGDTSYTNRNIIYSGNPFTGLRWTFNELSNLQAGLAIRAVWGVGWATHVRCTQVFLTVSLDFLIQP